MRNLGLTARQKMLLQILVALLIGVLSAGAARAAAYTTPR